MTQEHPITPPPELSGAVGLMPSVNAHRTNASLPRKPPAGALIRSWRRAVNGFKSFTKLSLGSNTI
jgi:hypothetical protein